MKSKFPLCVLESVWLRWAVLSVGLLAIISSYSPLGSSEVPLLAKAHGRNIIRCGKENSRVPTPHALPQFHNKKS